jgi:prolipoprotein diacylglyceryltransferase
MGQWLSIPLIAAGLLIMIFKVKWRQPPGVRKKKKSVSVR